MMSKDPETEEEIEKYCIIETGFNIFFLIAQYVEYKGDIRKAELTRFHFKGTSLLIIQIF